MTKKVFAANSAAVKQSVNETVNAVLEDKKSLNKILILIENLEHDDNPGKADVARVSSSLNGLVTLVQTMIRRGDFDDADKEDESEQKLKVWLMERFDEIWSKLLTFWGRQDAEKIGRGTFARLSLLGSFKILQSLNERHLEKKTDSFHTLSPEAIKRFRSMLPILCSSTQNSRNAIKMFTEYFEYHDVKQNILLCLSKFLKQFNKDNEPSDILKENTLSVLEKIKLSKPSEEEVRTVLRSDSKKSTYTFDYESVRKTFSDVWENFLKFKMTSNLYKRVLVILNDDVMPHLKRPLLLTDFLMTSYNIGGVISVLALNGVFRLISEYNLEYPDFYAKLYQLFDPDILAAKYRARFFYQADIFLSSSHLPEYLVAAFIKRLARLCLTAPANSILLAIPFITNLLLRHPGLTRMLKGDDKIEQAKIADPFLMNENDPAKSKAVDSFLWEIVTLQNHSLPQVSQAAKNLIRKLPEMEFDLADYLEFSMGDMMKVETRKKIFVNVPLTFERPQRMAFPKNDITSSLFSNS